MYCCMPQRWLSGNDGIHCFAYTVLIVLQTDKHKERAIALEAALKSEAQRREIRVKKYEAEKKLLATARTQLTKAEKAASELYFCNTCRHASEPGVVAYSAPSCVMCSEHQLDRHFACKHTAVALHALAVRDGACSRKLRVGWSQR